MKVPVYVLFSSKYLLRVQKFQATPTTQYRNHFHMGSTSISSGLWTGSQVAAFSPGGLHRVCFIGKNAENQGSKRLDG